MIYWSNRSQNFRLNCTETEFSTMTTEPAIASNPAAGNTGNTNTERPMTAESTTGSCKAADMNTASRPSTVNPNGAARTTNGKRNLPERFRDPSKFKSFAKKQHPLYTTTSSQIGARVPSAHELPTSFYGKSGRFTTGLAGLFYRNNGLNTSADKPKV
ncbi:protein of unknown function (DUF4490) [Carpediemonas membranifera]|uniref:Uncharacterized protein n=1 Tax=Carpediemonas membranifera TaxID=201153 RepID=A0A8J6BX49_9EUKA|nr:protein of unknown function (DUF4490) [Carpediemonas membranifera]|eukprot:KAG9393096.1 protein of unknown function (DUF4490) [Carpediemonas membranifera]